MKWTYVPQHSPNAGLGSLTLRPINLLAIARCSFVTRMAMSSKSTPRSLQSFKVCKPIPEGHQLSQRGPAFRGRSYGHVGPEIDAVWHLRRSAAYASRNTYP